MTSACLSAGKHSQLDRCITFTRIHEGDPRYNRDPVRPVTLLLTFTPKAAMTTSLQLMVSRAGGGQWKIEISLEALQPDMDGLVGPCSTQSFCTRFQ